MTTMTSWTSKRVVLKHKSKYKKGRQGLNGDDNHTNLKNMQIYRLQII